MEPEFLSCGDKFNGKPKQLSEDKVKQSNSRNNDISDEANDLSVSYTACGLITDLNLEKYLEVCDEKETSTQEVKLEDEAFQNLLKVVDGKKLYCCPFCDYENRRKSSIRDHLVTHTGESPFKCDECGRGFTRAGHLVIHKRTHTGDKPFKCTMCSFASNTPRSVKEHMAGHTGEKIYSCKLCSYQCSNSGNLSSHARTHTGDKPYCCPHSQCEFASAHSGSLKKHIVRKHTGNIHYLCPD